MGTAERYGFRSEPIYRTFRIVAPVRSTVKQQ
jgi:hypothetical protein